jgi:Tfp pilus assembly protein PilO
MATVLLIAALVVYFDFLIPAYGDLESVKGQELSEQNLLTNEQQVVQQVKNLLQSYNSESQGDQAVNAALPIGPNIANALTQIYGLASNSALAVQSVAVGLQAPQAEAESAVEENSSEIAAVANGESIVKPLGTISFTITATGSYEGLKKFLQGLETNVRLFDTTALNVQSSQVTSQGSGKGTSVNPDYFSYAITVAAYYEAP